MQKLLVQIFLCWKCNLNEIYYGRKEGREGGRKEEKKKGIRLLLKTAYMIQLSQLKVHWYLPGYYPSLQRKGPKTAIVYHKLS